MESRLRMMVDDLTDAPRAATLTLGRLLIEWEVRQVLYRVPLLFSPQPEGGFTVTSPILPELVTEGDSLDDAFSNAKDALAAVVELYEDQGRQLPVGVVLPASGEMVWSDALVGT